MVLKYWNVLLLSDCTAKNPAVYILFAAPCLDITFFMSFLQVRKTMVD